jgi:REP element-mobilizing transposase RayT
MGRLQRMYSDTGMYFVTARTIQGRMLLRPTPETNEVVGGVLAKAVMLSGVELHGYVVLSNHVHLLVTARGAALSKCMQYFLGNTAKKVSKLVDWSGTFWERRFSAQPVLDDASSVERLNYILSHGVKEGLVRRPEEWPGLSCLGQLLQEDAVIYRFFHWTKRWQKGAMIGRGEHLLSDKFAEKVSLRLTPLPCWKNNSKYARRRKIDALVKDIVAAGKAKFESVLGRKAVQRQAPHEAPTTLKKSTQPLCHAASVEARHVFRQTLQQWVAVYKWAATRFRNGDWMVQFPPWALRPGGGTYQAYQVCGT